MPRQLREGLVLFAGGGRVLTGPGNASVDDDETSLPRRPGLFER